MMMVQLKLVNLVNHLVQLVLQINYLVVYHVQIQTKIYSIYNPQLLKDLLQEDVYVNI
jgi:hypothetical protein